jgi:hypothetical protein
MIKIFSEVTIIPNQTNPEVFASGFFVEFML